MTTEYEGYLVLLDAAGAPAGPQEAVRLRADGDGLAVTNVAPVTLSLFSGQAISAIALLDEFGAVVTTTPVNLWVTGDETVTVRGDG